jgi:hypothetical protein
MNTVILTRSVASALIVAGALAASTLTPARAADSPCTAASKPADSQMPGQGSSTAGDTKTVPDGFGHQVVPGYGTTAPGTPSQLAAERKKDDKMASTQDATPDTSCK